MLIREKTGCRMKDACKEVGQELEKTAGAVAHLCDRYVQWAKQEGIELVRVQPIRHKKEPQEHEHFQTIRRRGYLDAMGFASDIVSFGLAIEEDMTEEDIFENYVFHHADGREFGKEDRIAEVKRALVGAPIWVREAVKGFFTEGALVPEAQEELKRLMLHVFRET